MRITPSRLQFWLAALLLALPLLPGAARAEPGSVLGELEIGDATGGFGGVLADGDRFGSAVAPLGDLDGDGVGDLAVGALFDDDGGTDRGAVWVLFLNADGTVKTEQKISSTSGGFGGTLDDDDNFGASLASLGDLDGDGRTDLAVGAPVDGDGGTARGAVWVLFLNADGTVKTEQKISSTSGGFAGPLADIDLFGSAVARLRDLDGDGVDELAVGAIGDDDGGALRGAVWVLFLDTDGTVQSEQKISATSGDFVGPLATLDQFGWSLASLDDLDGDGLDDLAVGAQAALSGGAIWILFLAADGTVRAEQKISDTTGGFAGAPGNLGWSLAEIGDVNGDAHQDLAAGAPLDGDGGDERGAVWLLFLSPAGLVLDEEKISSTSGGFTGPLADEDNFGFSVAHQAGTGALAVGAYRTDGGGSDRGAVWQLEIERAPQAVPALGGPALVALVAGLGVLGSRSVARRRFG